jgi:hypothetical protein
MLCTRTSKPCEKGYRKRDRLISYWSGDCGVTDIFGKGFFATKLPLTVEVSCKSKVGNIEFTVSYVQLDAGSRSSTTGYRDNDFYIFRARMISQLG